jgi:hypothetical protein
LEIGKRVGRQGGRFRGFAKTLKSVRNRVRQLLRLERYRPEEHYMRGPGPKTREKLKHGTEASA